MPHSVVLDFCLESVFVLGDALEPGSVALVHRPITGVFAMQRKPEVGGVHASPVTALVVYLHTLRDSATGQRIANPVGTVVLIHHTEPAIHIPQAVGCPLPAFVLPTPIHLRPEPLR